MGLQMDKDKTKGEETQEELSKIRLTLSAKEIKSLEDVCSQIIAKTREMNFKFRGPVRMPTKTLRITTRKSPCGEGTNTFDRFELRIHKRVIDLNCPVSKVKDITGFKIEPGIVVNVSFPQIITIR
eukprot:TRINITY_DN763_c0_g1_i12.p2 TRINITY_DN763_c0_g1~~TRINITY_DN763_c0_g1_i12.p2  ORF type:complete len:126 (-),score=20.47 TRINITY_DN763_c0_g1_i12:32-409(-)